MAYATGTGLVITDLMDALRSFAVGQGWTVDKWDAPNKLLFLTKGLCAVTMHGDTTQTLAIWTGPNAGGASTNQPDHCLEMSLNTSNTAALTTYHSHPGSQVTSEFDGDRVEVNGLTGAFIAWHFFADATVSDHIHCIVQLSAEVYQHFSFGMVDKKGLTHSGVAYVTGGRIGWGRITNTYISLFTGSQSNRPMAHPVPFCRQGTLGGPGSTSSSPGIILKNSDAWPAAWNGPIAAAGGSAPHFGTSLRLLTPGAFEQQTEYPVQGNSGNCLDVAVIGQPTPYSNQTPLFPMPLFRAYTNSGDPTLNRICYLGDFPNVRLCNMQNLTPGQEITYGADTYKVFPAVRQSSDAEFGVTEKPCSGQLAIAYKKV